MTPFEQPSGTRNVAPLRPGYSGLLQEMQGGDTLGWGGSDSSMDAPLIGVVRVGVFRRPVLVQSSGWFPLRRTAHGFTNPANYATRGLLLT